MQVGCTITINVGLPACLELISGCYIPQGHLKSQCLFLSQEICHVLAHHYEVTRKITLMVTVTVHCCI